jgi:hypothetical protein
MMSGRRKEIAPELMAQARRLYENTLTPAREIALMMGLSRNTFDNRVCEWGWVRRQYVSGGPAIVDAPQEAAAIPARAQSLPAVHAEVSIPAAGETRFNFVARLQRVIEGQFNVLDRTLKVLNPTNDAEAERTSRTLAGITRMLQELKVTATSAGLTPPDEADHDPIPRDMDEFRNELARRIHALIDAGSAEPNGGVGEVRGGDVEPGP